MQTLVAVYPSRAEAEQMKRKLVGAGISQERIALSPECREDDRAIRAASRPKGFWDWLFGSDVPDTDRELYSSALCNGRMAISVSVADGTQTAKVESMLHEHGAVALQAEPIDAGAAGREERIPVVKEELQVGKRQTEQRYHVRIYPVERPVQESVNLRDERVVVERRPTSTYTPDSKDFAPRELDVVERHEQPVVGKKARATEEVVVRKDVKEHRETVRDTVRETKVDVDKPSAPRRRTG